MGLKVFYLFVAVAYATALTAGIILWNISVTVFQVELGKILVAAVILHGILSIRSVGPKELGGILLFGKPVAQVSSGLVFVPFLICSLETESRLTIQEQFPGETENIFWGDQDDANHPLPAGKVWPLRAITASAETDKGDNQRIGTDPTHSRMAVYASALCRFKIVDFIQFLTTIGDKEEAIRQIRDTVESTIIAEFAKRTPARILAELDDLNRGLEAAVEKLVSGLDANGNPDPTSSWGVEIVDVNLVRVELPRTVNEALRDIPAAKLRKQNKTLEGQGNRAFIEEEGAGKAHARQSYLEAEAKGLEATGLALKDNPGAQLALRAATIREMDKSRTTYVSGSATDLLNLVGPVAQLITDTKKE